MEVRQNTCTTMMHCTWQTEADYKMKLIMIIINKKRISNRIIIIIILRVQRSIYTMNMLDILHCEMSCNYCCGHKKCKMEMIDFIIIILAHL